MLPSPRMDYFIVGHAASETISLLSEPKYFHYIIISYIIIKWLINLIVLKMDRSKNSYN